MNRQKQLCLLLYILLLSCNKKMYSTNGETIYRTGRNIQGEKMLNRRASKITIVNSCRACHGKNGDAVKRFP